MGDVMGEVMGEVKGEVKGDGAGARGGWGEVGKEDRMCWCGDGGGESGGDSIRGIGWS